MYSEERHIKPGTVVLVELVVERVAYTDEGKVYKLKPKAGGGWLNSIELSEAEIIQAVNKVC